MTFSRKEKILIHPPEEDLSTNVIFQLEKKGKKLIVDMATCSDHFPTYSVAETTLIVPIIA